MVIDVEILQFAGFLFSVKLKTTTVAMDPSTLGWYQWMQLRSRYYLLGSFLFPSLRPPPLLMLTKQFGIVVSQVTYVNYRNTVNNCGW